MMMKRFVEPYIRTALREMGADPNHLISFEFPRQEGFGHLSTTVALALAKSLRTSPKAIAEQIVASLGKVPMVSTIDVAGPGFINFTFEPAAFHSILRDLVAEGLNIGRSDIGDGKRANVEYVSANPTGPLHAGHGRNCAIGDTIANIYEWCGYHVTREYYFNNAGNQMNKLGESIASRILELHGKSELIPFPADGYHGEYIRFIAQANANDYDLRRLEALMRQDGTESGVVINENYINEFRKRCSKLGEKWCFESIQKTLKSLGIHHEVYFNEDTLYADGKIEATIAQLKAKDLVYERDGALWFALEKLGNPQDKVIVKSTGEPTYRLPDIAYHADKLSRDYDLVIDIFGSDHIATIPDVMAGIKALGFDVERVRIVIHQMVTFVENGEVVKFSKRSGKSFTLDELIEEVGPDVVRFFFIMRAPGTHLDFDLGLAKEEGEKNPVFYLQYAHARISSILRKAGRNPTSADLSALTHRRELDLIGLLSRFREEVERSCQNLEPHTLAEYLRDLATAYHQFYHDCRILGSEKNIEDARLLLAGVTRMAMANGLNILGVTAPETM